MTYELTPQIESDRKLLQFANYEEYLDSLIYTSDFCYLQSATTARTLAELGYRCAGSTLSREEFQKRLKAVVSYLFPTFHPYELASEHMPPTNDPLQKELALRERANRLGILTTIIFIRNYTKRGFELSGYIDYGERLHISDWKPFFRGDVLLWPNPSDLGYFHWRRDICVSTDSLNFKALIDPIKGVMFQNRFDRKVICVAPSAKPGHNTTRVRILSPNYQQVILYDHVVIQRI